MSMTHRYAAPGHCEDCGKTLVQVAEPVQEPVAWLTPRNVDSYPRPDLGYETSSKTDYGAFPVYTAPPQRKPLTEEEIESCRQQGYAHAGLNAPFDFVKAARAVEQAHGIKE